MSKQRVGHICGYFGPDPGAGKKPRTAKGLLKRMAYCQRQGEKHRGYRFAARSPFLATHKCLPEKVVAVQSRPGSKLSQAGGDPSAD